MSSCGNCDCADKNQCGKKGNSFGMEITEARNSFACLAMGGEENEPKCRCGPNCTCTNCTCGH